MVKPTQKIENENDKKIKKTITRLIFSDLVKRGNLRTNFSSQNGWEQVDKCGF